MRRNRRLDERMGRRPRPHREPSARARLQIDLSPWAHDAEPEVLGSLTGGNRNPVHEIVLGGRRAVVRRSRRDHRSLDWELDLLDRLGRHGFRVPETVPTVDGRRHVDGLVVQSFLEGREPVDEGDWWLVAAELRRLHAVTGRTGPEAWTQRPGCASVVELGAGDRSGDADLAAVPDGVVEDCRRAWAPLRDLGRSVVHGDPGAPNVRIDGSAVGLLDWDEARVDVSVLDLADLPVPALDEPLAGLARRAADAWEVVNGWVVEPSYARRRLQRLRSPRR